MHDLVYNLFNFNPLGLQGGCITKLERFLADHLLIIGSVGIGVACMQVSKIWCVIQTVVEEAEHCFLCLVTLCLVKSFKSQTERA